MIVKRVVFVLLVIVVFAGIFVVPSSTNRGDKKYEILVMEDYYQSGRKYNFYKVQVENVKFELRNDKESYQSAKLEKDSLIILMPNWEELEFWKEWLAGKRFYQPSIPIIGATAGGGK